MNKQLEKTSTQGKIVILDIETAGKGRSINKQEDLIVEIGITAINLFTGDKKIIYNTLVNEGITDEYKESWVFNNTNIKIEDVRNAPPLNYEEVSKILACYYSTSFNRSFDFDFIDRRCINFNSLDCLMLLSEPICEIPATNDYYRGLGQFKWPSVQEVWDMFLEEDNGTYIEKHRAGDDSFHESFIAKWLFDLGKLKLPKPNKD